MPIEGSRSKERSGGSWWLMTTDTTRLKSSRRSATSSWRRKRRGGPGNSLRFFAPARLRGEKNRLHRQDAKTRRIAKGSKDGDQDHKEFEGTLGFGSGERPFSSEENRSKSIQKPASKTGLRSAGARPTYASCVARSFLRLASPLCLHVGKFQPAERYLRGMQTAQHQSTGAEDTAVVPQEPVENRS